MGIKVNEDGITIINGKYGPISPKVTVFAKRACGCCTAELRFHSIERAQEAFKKAGLDVSATIRDDSGDEYDDIDTFYGFTKTSQEAESRSLGYLFNEVVSKVK